MVPFNQLDAVQSQAIEDIDANLTSFVYRPDGKATQKSQLHWVQGFAGSGKTIVLTHLAERLAAKQKEKRIGFATYTLALKDLVLTGLSDQAKRYVRLVTFDSLKSLRVPFDILIADEVQDVSKRYFNEFRRSYVNLVAAADFDQRIYRQAAAEAVVRGLLSKSSHHQLIRIFRVSENIFHVATAVHSDAVVAAEARIYERDEKTKLITSKTRDQEWDAVYDEAVRVAAPQFPSAILFPDKSLMEGFLNRLAVRQAWPNPPPKRDWGIPANPDSGERKKAYGKINDFLRKRESCLQVFGSGSGELSTSATKRAVYLMTYHSAKGLEFDSVFLPGLSEGVSLQAMKRASDLEERRLFFVAATRARRQLYLSYHATPHRFISEIPSNLLESFRPPRRGFGR